jgi:hypothetical protein
MGVPLLIDPLLPMMKVMIIIANPIIDPLPDAVDQTNLLWKKIIAFVAGKRIMVDVAVHVMKMRMRLILVALMAAARHVSATIRVALCAMRAMVVHLPAIEVGIVMVMTENGVA